VESVDGVGRNEVADFATCVEHHPEFDVCTGHWAEDLYGFEEWVADFLEVLVKVNLLSRREDTLILNNLLVFLATLIAALESLVFHMALMVE
jgi:hypothetical protein